MPWSPHDAPTGEVGFVVSGKGVDFPMSHGLAGGYPGTPGRYVICRGARRGNAASALPLSLGDIGGEHEAVSFGVYRVGDEDVFYVRWNGGGGVRDPLARDPRAVARDIAEGVVSADAARGLYGVVVAAADGGLDVDATQQRRVAMRGERSGTNITALASTAAIRHATCKDRLCPGKRRRQRASAFVNG